jgi:DNA-binding beta-propeller fold protein YncE
LYLALRAGNAVYRIDPKTEKIYHIAGTGQQGYEGDGGPAKLAKLAGPKGIAYSRDGGVYIADTESHTIRRIDLKTGTIATVLGNGKRGELARPHGGFVDKKGAVYVGDSESHRILLLK